MSRSIPRRVVNGLGLVCLTAAILLGIKLCARRDSSTPPPCDSATVSLTVDSTTTSKKAAKKPRRERKSKPRSTRPAPPERNPLDEQL